MHASPGSRSFPGGAVAVEVRSGDQAREHLLVGRLRERPASAAIALVLLVLSVATGSVLQGPRPEIRRAFGVDLDAVARHHDLIGLLTSALLPGSLPALGVALAALLLLVGAAEPLMGPGRILLAYFSTALVGTAGGIGLQALGVLAPRIALAPPGDTPVLDPFTPIAGAVLAASAFAGPLWRRRIRVVGLIGLLVVLLYSGQPADLYRVAGGVAGMALGVVLARHRPRVAFRRSSHHEARGLLASLVAVTAVGPFVALMVPRGHGLLHPLGRLLRGPTPEGLGSDLACRAVHPAIECAREIALVRLGGPGAVALSALPLLVLVVAAVGMARGRRVAAIAAVALELLYALLAAVYFDALPLLSDPDQIVLPRAPSITVVQAVLGLVVPLGVAAAVALNLRHFEVRSSPAATRLFLGTVISTGVAGSVVYVAGGLVVRAQFSPRVGVLDLLGDLPERFVPVGFLRLRRLDFIPAGPAAHLLWDWIGPVAWAVLLVALALCTASVRDRGASSDLARVRLLLRQGSIGPVAHMATWPGNRYWFSADGRHAVAYREVNGLALTLGEPLGRPSGAGEAARAFALFCDDTGLTPVFYAVRPEFVRPLGLDRAWASAVIAEDAVLRPGTFRMAGRRWADVRSSINRAEREGVRAEWTTWERASLAQRLQIEAVSEEWMTERPVPELGFTLGGLDELRDPDVGLMLAIGPGERVEAVTSWLPAWRDGVLVGLTLDLMRRRPDGMSGAIEFLIASVALRGRHQGLESLSLSAAPLATSTADEGDALVLERVLGRLSRVLEPAYGFQSLAAFKEKFQPSLQPLVLAYPEAAVLPAVGLALARAYLPDLSVPTVLRLVSALR